jgi:hypothetical protein
VTKTRRKRQSFFAIYLAFFKHFIGTIEPIPSAQIFVRGTFDQLTFSCAAVLMCSGRNPTPTTRAGMRRRYGNRRSNFKIQGSDMGFVAPRTRLITLFCTTSCMRCVARVGNIRRWRDRQQVKLHFVKSILEAFKGRVSHPSRSAEGSIQCFVSQRFPLASLRASLSAPRKRTGLLSTVPLMRDCFRSPHVKTASSKI